MNSGRLRALTGTATITVLLILSAGTAFSASKSVNDCDSVKRDLMSLEVPQNTLSLSNVDHASDDATPASLNADGVIDDIENLGEVSAPILYLTPRVTDLLQDVFSGARKSSRPATEMTSSPLADSAEEPDSAVLDIENDASTDDEMLPTFQQQMFRKDI